MSDLNCYLENKVVALGKKVRLQEKQLITEYKLRDKLDVKVAELLEALERATQWLRRLEKEYPKCLNDDAIEKHLEPVISKAKGESGETL